LEEERAILEVGVFKSFVTKSGSGSSQDLLGGRGSDRRIGSDFESHSWLYENDPTQPLAIGYNFAQDVKLSSSGECVLDFYEREVEMRTVGKLTYFVKNRVATLRCPRLPPLHSLHSEILAEGGLGP
jgi:hypothetical protein